jgi:hypothetical protein
VRGRPGDEAGDEGFQLLQPDCEAVDASFVGGIAAERGDGTTAGSAPRLTAPLAARRRLNATSRTDASSGGSAGASWWWSCGVAAEDAGVGRVRETAREISPASLVAARAH